MTDQEEIKGLKTGREILKVLWSQGLTGRKLLEEHTQLIDNFILGAFSSIPERDREGVCLVALGGYGRRELFPFSDVDLMLLFDPDRCASVEGAAEAVFYPLWDANIDLGHGVRTVDESLAHAEKDFFFEVALLDARFLAGDRELFSQLLRAFKERLVEGKRRAFVENMIAHRAERHSRFGSHVYMLEPNIKESRGGLRDIQSVFWTSKVLFGLETMDHLEEAGLVSGKEREEVEAAWDHLIQVRNRLHYASERKNDRLFFEYQQEIAAGMGVGDTAERPGVERFMQEVYRCLETIAIFSDLFFQHIDEVLLRGGRAGGEEKEVEQGIAVLRGRLYVPDPSEFDRRPHLMMKLFYHSSLLGLPVHHRTLKAVSERTGLVDERFRKSARNAKWFISLLENGKDPASALGFMLNSGFLEAYIPEFRPIRSMAQYDVYHVFTVDRHLIQTVAELVELREREQDLFRSLASPHLLYLAALFHDLGKGRGGGHAAKGAKMAREIGERLGLAPEEIDCLSFVVDRHLFLVDTAMRRDLDDEMLILKCARAIKDPDRLTMLYLLSIADSKATGPTVWNDWKAALLTDLFLKISHLLERKDLNDPDRIQAVEWMREQLSDLLERRGMRDVSLDIFPEDYLLSFTPEAVVRHVKLKQRLEERPLLIFPEDRGHFWSVLVIAKDRTGLLARICGVLALNGLNVLSAHIFTLRDGTAIDILDVNPVHETEFGEQDWDRLQEEMLKAYEDRLGLSYRLATKYKREGGAAPACRLAKPKVKLDNDSSDFHTIIEVYAEDRPGLVYDITKTLSDFGINIHRAKIGTSGDQVVDVFYVLDPMGQKLEDEDMMEELQGALLYAARCGTV